MIGSIAKFKSENIALALNIKTNNFVRDKLQDQILLIIGECSHEYGYDLLKVYCDGLIYLVNKEDLRII